MKKSVWTISGIIVAAIIGILAIVIVNDRTSHSPAKPFDLKLAADDKKKTSNFKEYKACDILTADIAQKIAGSDASIGSTPSPQVSTHSVSVTNCSYYSASTKNTVSLLSRSALDQTGADTNNAQFSTKLPVGAQKVHSYGDGAYWDPTYGQFNILKHNNWYILQTGGFKPTDRTLDQAKEYADKIIDKL